MNTKNMITLHEFVDYLIKCVEKDPLFDAGVVGIQITLTTVDEVEELMTVTTFGAEILDRRRSPDVHVKEEYLRSQVYGTNAFGDFTNCITDVSKNL